MLTQRVRTCSLQHTYAELEPEAMGSCHKMLAVNLGTLAQLTASFSHMYQEEMQPWCGREAPPLTPLGPTCKRVDMLKAELDKVGGSMHTDGVSLSCMLSGIPGIGFSEAEFQESGSQISTG